MALSQSHFRFGKEELLEATHGWWQNEDVNHTQLISANWAFLLRFCVQADATGLTNVDNEFQYNKNGAGWVNITTTSSVVKAVASVAFTNAQNCTKRLSGTGTFETTAAGCTEDGISGGTANDIVASGNSETEAGLQVVFADVVNGDTIQFRLTRDGGVLLNSYPVTPTLTIVIAGLTAIGDTVQKIWNVRQAVPDTSQFVYHIRATIGDTSQSIWNVKTFIGDTIQHIWHIKTSIGDTIQQIWNTRQAIGDTIQKIWNVRTSIGDTSQHIWNVLSSVTAVGDIFELRWHIRQAIAQTSQSIWHVRAIISDTIQTDWHIRAIVSDTLQHIWNVLEITAKTTQLIYNIRKALGDVIQSLWNVRIMQRFQITTGFALKQDLILRAELSRLLAMSSSVSRELSLTTKIERI